MLTKQEIINIKRLCDSVHKRMNDSVASQMLTEIKNKYPNITVHQTARQSGNSHITKLKFNGYPGDGATGFGNDPRTDKRDNWVKFLKYLKQKYANKTECDIDYDYIEIWE